MKLIKYITKLVGWIIIYTLIYLLIGHCIVQPYINDKQDIFCIGVIVGFILMEFTNMYWNLMDDNNVNNY